MDKRQTERIGINHEFGSVDEFLREYALNLSLGGVFIRTNEVLSVGTVVDLKFTVIVDDFETIEGEGRVVRAVLPGQSDRPGIGVVFTKLSPRSKQVLARLFTLSTG